MCKWRAITCTKPYTLYSGVDAAGSVLFYEPINRYYLLVKLICVIYATAVIIWSMADLAEQNISYSLWFAFRINWITLLIWIYFILSLFISVTVNYQKKVTQSLTIPSFTEWSPEHDEMDDDDINYRRLETYKLYSLHQFARICLQISISAIVFMSILYYIDYKHIFQHNAIPEFVLNIQTHGILAIGLCLDYFTSCTQIRYIFGSFLVLFFNVISLVWTYIFYRAEIYNPLTHSNILYPIINWDISSNFISILQVWIAGTIAHWFIHMLLVYLKFVVICYWIDRRRFTMDIIDEKAEHNARLKKTKKEQNKNVGRNANKLTTYEFEPLLL